MGEPFSGRTGAADNTFPASMNLSTLTGMDGFVLNGAGGDDRSGYSVASAGDVNGDGIADLVIGATVQTLMPARATWSLAEQG